MEGLQGSRFVQKKVSQFLTVGLVFKRTWGRELFLRHGMNNSIEYREKSRIHYVADGVLFEFLKFSLYMFHIVWGFRCTKDVAGNFVGSYFRLKFC